VRDATYVLDEILDNETELPILEHTTDTAGYTEVVFALLAQNWRSCHEPPSGAANRPRTP
jgi:hypothetical protein